MNLSLYDLHRELKMKRILFCYSGPMAQASIEGVGSTLRRNLEFEESGKMTQMAVFSTFIEQVQNVLNYSAEKLGPEDNEEELRVGITVVGHDDSGNYCVYCGNRVYNRDIERISQSIDALRHLTKDELKALYKERRRSQPSDGDKGAGLGLIEMARRALTPLEYSFEPIDEILSFFSIKVVIGRV